MVPVQGVAEVAPEAVADVFEELFGQGERSIFFPTGGHLGNLEHRDVMAAVVRYFQ